MDTTAHRIIHQARSMLVDELNGCAFVPTDADRDTIARAMGHGFNADQAEQLVSICSQLMSLMLDDPAPPECETCATPITQPATGRPRTYCRDACRQQQARLRRIQSAIDARNAR